MSIDDLPDAELEVLAVLWERGDSTVREVRESLSPLRPMSHAAAFTLLGRLEEKGAVRRRKGEQGKAFVFKAVIKPGRTYRRQARNLVDRVFRGRSVTLVSSLFESSPPSPDELVELQRLLDEFKASAGEEESP